jgi:PilZ domain
MPEDVWVYWRCDGYDDLSRVHNISLGGLFILAPKPKAAGITANIHFLVQEGQVRADAVVRHAVPGRGIGLKFKAVKEEDRAHLASLITRIRALARTYGKI